MKKFFVTVLAASLFTGMAYAAPITFTDTTQFTPTGTVASEDLQDYGRGDVNKLDGTGDFVSWQHFFTFDPPAAEILSGTLKLYLQDDADPWYAPFEIGLGASEGGTWDFGAINTGAYSYDVEVAYLADGAFGVTLASVLGDFLIVKSELDVAYQPVPEPSTILLLAGGLMSLGFFGHRRTMSRKP